MHCVWVLFVQRQCSTANIWREYPIQARVIVIFLIVVIFISSPLLDTARFVRTLCSDENSRGFRRWVLGHGRLELL